VACVEEEEEEALDDTAPLYGDVDKITSKTMIGLHGVAVDAQSAVEVRLRAEVEASIRAEEEPRIRAEVEAIVRAEQEEAFMRARIRAEIQAEVEDKMRAEIRAELIAEWRTETCAICLGKSVDPSTTACGHTFCSGCLAKWRNRGSDECPMCRSCLS